VNWRGRQWRDA